MRKQLLADRDVVVAIERADNPNHDIESAGFMLVVAEYLAHHAPHIISCYRLARDLARHHDRQAGKTQAVWLGLDR